MSTQETPERPREHRRHLAVVSVAAAVLLAGGGGAYWASTSGDGAPAARDGTSEGPRPLALDGVGREESGAGDGRSGVAPGEPHPNGHATYRAAGELPDGPDSAPVFRRTGSVTKSEVAAVAKALGVPGTPKLEHGRWTIAGAKDDGPSLSVGDDRATGMWSYARQSGLIHMTCGTPGSEGAKVPDRTKCSGTDGGTAPSDAGGGSSSSSPDSSSSSSPDSSPDGAEPVAEEKAKAAVRPALAALDLKGAGLDASSAYGSFRVVSAQPQVDGLPTHDWGGSFTVGPDGQVSRGHGQLGRLTEGAGYPVMSAGETLKDLNKYGGPRPLEARCAIPPTAPKAKSAPDAAERGDGSSAYRPCGPGTGTPTTLSVTKATFGLATQFSYGKPVLVPSWIYEVKRPGGPDTYPVTYPAVQPKFLDRTGGGNGGTGGDDGATSNPAPPPGGSDRAGQALSSFRADGRTLTVTFWGGVCHKYAAKADASGDKVTVSVKQKERDPDKACVMMAKKQTVKVTLDKPLGDREVVDARDGEPLPRK